MIQDYLLLGEIVRPQGIRGEVKVKHFTDDPARFLELQTVYRLQNDAYAPLAITGARVQKDDVFLALAGVATRDDAEKLRGTRLYVDRAHARELGQNEAFIADLLGATAFDTQGRELGTLKDVYHAGGADVFVFQTPRGEMALPALARVVKELDAAAGRVVLDEQALGEVALYENSDSNHIPGDV